MIITIIFITLLVDLLHYRSIYYITSRLLHYQSIYYITGRLLHYRSIYYITGRLLHYRSIYYITGRLLHYRSIYYITGRLLHYWSIITLPVDYYITGCNNRSCSQNAIDLAEQERTRSTRQVSSFRHPFVRYGAS